MRLSPEEKRVRREIEAWQHGTGTVLSQAVNWAMSPVDWLMDRMAPEGLVDRLGEGVEQGLAVVSDASEWTHDAGDLLKKARARGLDAEHVEDLRHEPLAELDPLARSLFTQNAVLAAVEGGGTGMGGLVLLAADVPLLFGINFRLIQQIGTAYGFPLRGPSFRPLALSVFNVAASGAREARNEALREVSVAASAFAEDRAYRGRVTGVFRDQNRHVPREIAKNLAGRKLAQSVPVAGAAVGAGINYWFTTETAETAYMLFRALYLDWKERL